MKDDDPPIKSDAEQEPVESFVPNVDSHLTGNIISDSTINDNIFHANEQPEDDDEIIVVCSPPRKQDKSDSPPCSPPTLPEAETSEHDAQISLKSDVAEQREADAAAAAEAQAAAEADSEPVQEIDVVNDNPPNDHDQVQKLNDFDSAKAVNRYILQTNNTSSSSNIHNSSNHINNENINDATAPAALNEDIIDDANGTNAATADSISHDASGIAQADKHTASATNNNNNYQQQQSNATAAAATGASVESVEYATLAATDLCGGTLTVQGVDSEQSENFVVTSGYIQECGY